ncbi:hypothetical protein LB518_22695 [Mesorhizobium sp. BR1-1-16]|uniref:glycine-rich domain-containing protein n=1 Tax=Mesorhizobium sp. BR1-1-16 TaxID=2876653 RepID=UPI001CCD5E6F|nr:hypothetical protein [Mesorhizobium sp. BR1-1-16]MBZ9939123.1 hypothetical protein [Mesorhizobium sp. BR1-1-16]
MPTNEFLSYASGVSPNVTTQSDYAASGARTGGVVAGTADPMLANKAWRQGANMAAAIGSVIVAAGLDALDNADTAALFAAVQAALRAQIPNYVSAVGGTANALTATLSPAPAAWTDLVGVPLRLKIATTNTGAATLNPNSLGTKTIVRAGGAALSAGDLAAGSVVECVYDGTSVQAISLQSSFAPSSSVAVYTSSGTTSFVVPTGIYRLKRIRVWGAGGGGGGSFNTGGAGAGGGGAGYAESVGVAVSPGQSISIVVGAGGLAGTGTPTAGGAGGTTSVGSLISIPGGGGGTGANNIVGTSGGAGSSPTGGNLINVAGTNGGSGFTLGSGGSPVGGIGGSSPFGGSGPSLNVQAPGSGGAFPGGGANGGAYGGGGGIGAVGCVIIEY